jgi:hypothetical protein
LHNAIRDALANVVLFSERGMFANPVEGNIHVCKRSSVEATFHHGNPRHLIDENGLYEP